MRDRSPLPTIAMLLMALLMVAVPALAVNAPKDPCSLLTQDQVNAALGMKAAPGKRAATTMCEWDVPGQPFGIRGKKVTLGFLSASSWQYMKMQMPGGKVTKTPVSGLGDEAIFTIAGSTPLGTLNVKKGDIVLSIHVYGLPPDQQKEKAITLAKEALAKLG